MDVPTFLAVALSKQTCHSSSYYVCLGLYESEWTEKFPFHLWQSASIAEFRVGLAFVMWWMEWLRFDGMVKFVQKNVLTMEELIHSILTFNIWMVVRYLENTSSKNEMTSHMGNSIHIIWQEKRKNFDYFSIIMFTWQSG